MRLDVVLFKLPRKPFDHFRMQRASGPSMDRGLAVVNAHASLVSVDAGFRGRPGGVNYTGPGVYRAGEYAVGPVVCKRISPTKILRLESSTNTSITHNSRLRFTIHDVFALFPLRMTRVGVGGKRNFDPATQRGQREDSVLC